MPAKIEPAAIPEVMVEAMPANNKATAKITAALFPKSGCNKALASCYSLTVLPLLKKVAAANRIMALLIAQPIIMDKKVSQNS